MNVGIKHFFGKMTPWASLSKAFANQQCLAVIHMWILKLLLMGDVTYAPSLLAVTAKHKGVFSTHDNPCLSLTPSCL